MSKYEENPFTVDARALENGGQYTMNGSCANCGVRVTGTFSYGQEAAQASAGPACPHCGVRKLYWNRRL